MNIKNKSFCSLAFNHISTLQDGSARICCNTRDTLKDGNGITYNVGTHSLEEILNSEHYKKIRKSMINGDSVTECASCMYQEQYNEASPRLVYNRFYQINNPTEERSIADIQYMDLRFGNMCNLKCMTCSSHSSSQIEKETRAIMDQEPDIINFHSLITKDLNAWYKTETFTNTLSKVKNNLTALYLTGGEPTIVEENYRFMELLVNENLSKNITVRLSTNLTNINPKFFNLLKNFKQATLLCSIDGLGALQEYIRYPSNWNVIDDNFTKLTNADKIKVVITPTISNLNLEYISELFNYAENFNKKFGYRKLEIYPQLVFKPEIFNISYLPYNYRKYCWNKIENWLNNSNHKQFKLFASKMDQLKKLCLANDLDPGDRLIKLRRYIEIYKKHRGLDLNTVNPRLFEIISKA